MALPAWLSGIFKPAFNLVDELVTSKEEKGQIEVALTGALTSAGVKIMETEQALAAAQASIIIAEAQGQSWLQRNWRPITMLSFVFVVVWNWVIVTIGSWAFDVPIPTLVPPDLPSGLWSSIQIGIGGYIGGRSLEKVTATIMQRPEIFKKKEKKKK